MVQLENIQWGGSGIEKVVFDFICSKIPSGSTVIELGAGHVSTPALSTRYNVYSVEHKEEFVYRGDGVNAIYAPQVGDWYDVGILETILPPKEEQKLILIDGLNRLCLLDHLELFNPLALFIVHDSQRTQERELAFALSGKLRRPVTFHIGGDYWASI